MTADVELTERPQPSRRTEPTGIWAAVVVAAAEERRMRMRRLLLATEGREPTTTRATRVDLPERRERADPQEQIRRTIREAVAVEAAAVKAAAPRGQEARRGFLERAERAEDRGPMESTTVELEAMAKTDSRLS